MWAYLIVVKYKSGSSKLLVTTSELNALHRKGFLILISKL